MKVRFENIDRQTPANLAIQVRTLPHKFDGLYFQNAHPDLHPVYSGRRDPPRLTSIKRASIFIFKERKQKYKNGSIHRKLKVSTTVVFSQPKVQYGQNTRGPRARMRARVRAWHCALATIEVLNVKTGVKKAII
jgi:hypothetical protein